MNHEGVKFLIAPLARNENQNELFSGAQSPAVIFEVKAIVFIILFGSFFTITLPAFAELILKCEVGKSRFKLEYPINIMPFCFYIIIKLSCFKNIGNIQA